MFGFRGAPPAHVTMCVVVEYTDAGAALYPTTTPNIAARAKMRCSAVKVDRAATPLQTTRIHSNIYQIHWSVMNGFWLAAETLRRS
jgi:hypothetical protein